MSAVKIKISELLALVVAVILYFSLINRGKLEEKEVPMPAMAKKCHNLKCWLFALENFSEYTSCLRSHDRVFRRLNLEFVNGSNGEDFDILWSLETPFSKDGEHPSFGGIKNQSLKPHQKLNHFPGISGLITKSRMSYYNRRYDFILPSFLLPQQQKEFDKFIAKNPDKKILEKNFFNRGVKIIDVKDLEPKAEHFYQEFMDKPFLIDGHAFDFGVFVLITSFNPLRAYRFDEVLLRFCAEKYHPFDPQNRDKYVVQEGSIPVYEMPSFAEIFKKFKFPSKVMFEKLISSQGFNVKNFWKRIDRAISIILMNSEDRVMQKLKDGNYSSHNFFELVRFDIILNEKLKPFVVEVNMSPNLTPAEERYEKNSLIYEQLIFNVVKIIGGSSYHEFYSRLDETDLIVSNYKNLAISIDFCNDPKCSNCSETFCKICRPCMTPEVRYQLSEAFREHQNSANFKRVFPTKNHFDDEKLIPKMTGNNQIQMRWFKGKCEDDERWC